MIDNTFFMMTSNMMWVLPIIIGITIIISFFTAGSRSGIQGFIMIIPFIIATFIGFTIVKNVQNDIFNESINIMDINQNIQNAQEPVVLNKKYDQELINNTYLDNDKFKDDYYTWKNGG